MKIRRRSTVWPVVGLMLTAVLLSVIGGLAVAVGGVKVGAIFIVLILGFLVLFLPVDLLVLSTWVVVAVIAGTLQYLLNGWKYAQWMSFGLAFACLIRLPFEMIRNRGMAQRNVLTPAMSWSLVCLLVFVLLSATTSLANRVPGPQIAVFVKNVLVMWVIALIVAAGCLKPKSLLWIWQSMVVLVFVQIPMVLYQHFIVAKQRVANGSQYDAVAGTFGGDPRGGGANSTLVMFAIVGAIMAMALYSSGKLSRKWLVLTVLSALAVIGLGEVKVAILLIPMATAVLYLERLIRNPKQLLVWMASGVVIVSGTMVLYQKFYWSDIRGKHDDLHSSLQASLEYVTDPSNVNWSTGEVGRGASFFLWLRDTEGSPLYRLIGRGVGASRSESAVAVGEVALKYAPLNIAATSLSQLLWETGVLGLVAYIGVLLAAILECNRAIARCIPRSIEECAARTARVVLVLSLVFIPYNRYMLDQAPFEFLIALACGTAFVLRRMPAGARAARPQRGRRNQRADAGAVIPT